MTLNDLIGILNPQTEIRIFNFDESECIADTTVARFCMGVGSVWTKSLLGEQVVEITAMRGRDFANETLYYNGEIMAIYLARD